MGFPTERVLSDENHTAEFICAICQCLVEYPKLTPCSHTFCGACIDEWMKVGQMNCPTCKTPCTGASGQLLPLKEASPLAHRILLRVRVRCPLDEQGCKWSGDYSELQDHLTNSSEHLGSSSSSSGPQRGPGDSTEAPSGAGANAAALKDQGKRKKQKQL